MNEQSALEASRTQPTIRETSEERVWETPGYLVVETALEVTAYALGER
ncbi:pyrroloquinoline quinone precursor peptide PqqA [Streptomyces sp. R41]|uniref:Pyrroloquinoline quinone peptide PqqA n=1 Tax=Streptomyces sp. R41 TaxID=3238632 RepID=A0AB39RRD0_9ACTN